VAGYDAGYAQYVTEWGILDSYYVPTRYPNGLADDIPARVYNRSAAEAALRLVEAVLSTVQRHLQGRD
jgi:HEPN domain-containing protein